MAGRILPKLHKTKCWSMLYFFLATNLVIGYHENDMKPLLLGFHVGNKKIQKNYVN
jgi:hypothetical protein